MKTLIHLSSETAVDIGGKQAAGVSLIYMFLLKEYRQDHYRSISITLVDRGMDEYVEELPGKKVHVCLSHPLPADFRSKDAYLRNRIMVGLIHVAMNRIAHTSGKLCPDALEQIRDKVIDKNMSFAFEHLTRTRKTMTATLIVQPDMTRVDYYLRVDVKGRTKFKLWLCSKPLSVKNMTQMLSYMEWISDDEIVIAGVPIEEEIHVLVKEERAWTRQIAAFGLGKAEAAQAAG